ncbi:hypothetical protein PAPHI01_0038 [Pancytospora philotis]|nr:hypothetical protein PAPHI01_0038 [Pancytospora philotis]
MANPKKRLEALAELFNSEKSYVSDLALWQIVLRRRIRELEGINTDSKRDMCDSMFMNMDQIYRLHLRILQAMRRKNEEILRRYPEAHAAYTKKRAAGEILEPQGGATADSLWAGAEGDDPGDGIREQIEAIEFGIKKDGSMDTAALEYASVLLESIDGFRCYEVYAAHLPKSEYEFDRAMYAHREFEELVDAYLQENSIEQIGTKNFLYRPSSKLARYPLLLKAILKNEPDEQHAALYTRLVGSIQEVTRSVDKIFQASSNFFSMFLLNNFMEYGPGVDYQPFLGLIFKSTRVLKDGRIILKSANDVPAAYKQVYILNRAILFCNTPDTAYEPIYIREAPVFLHRLAVIRKPFALFGKDENLDSFYPLYLIQRDEGVKKAMYFEDENSRDIFFGIICKAIHNLRRKMRSTSRLEQRLELAEEPLYCMCSTAGACITVDEYACCAATENDPEPPTAEEAHSSEAHSSEAHSSEAQSTAEKDENIADSDEIKEESRSSFRERNSDKAPSHSQELEKHASFMKSVGSRPESETSSGLGAPKSLYENAELFLGQENTDESLPADFSSDSWRNLIDTHGQSNEFLFKDFFNGRADEPGRSLMGGRLHASAIQQPQGAGLGSGLAVCRDIIHDIFTKPKFYFTNMDFAKPSMGQTDGYHERQRRMLVYSTRRGIYRRIGDDITLVSVRPAKKLAYDREAELLFYLCDTELYVSKFNHMSDALDGTQLQLVVTDFFYGRNAGNKTLALTSGRDFGFSLIYLLEITDSGSVYQVFLRKKLYVGSAVSSIYFLNSKIIIACKNFEIVESSTLQTQDLLEGYDPLTQNLVRLIDGSLAKDIFRIDENVFLLCFDKVGFFVNNLGYWLNERAVFNWECIAHSFRLYHTSVMVLADTHFALFSLLTGDLVYLSTTPGLRFVDNTSEALLYDGRTLYEFSDSVLAEKHCVLYPDSPVAVHGHYNIDQTDSSLSASPSEYLATSSDDTIIKILKEVACQGIDPLKLPPDDSHEAPDAFSDDLCLQHYSMKLARRPKKKRGRPWKPVRAAVCREHVAPTDLASYTSPEAPKCVNKSKFKNVVALNGLSIKKAADEHRCKVNVNQQPPTQMPPELQKRIIDAAHRPGLAEQLKLCKVSVARHNVSRTSTSASTEQADSSSSGIGHVVSAYESVSTTDIINDYLPHPALVLKDKKKQDG